MASTRYFYLFLKKRNLFNEEKKATTGYDHGYIHFIHNSIIGTGTT
jgi:hypothetical protein